jgi:3'-phosphoadenosine 5'-phosphosulfate sulfotransferase (PAPS reductase)/FAD synthetase
MTILVQYSTGAGSAEVALRCVEQHGLHNVHLITADTAIEDDDNWRFAEEVWEYLGRPTWHRIRDGRTPMEVGRDERVVPNNRMAVCSKILKRKPLRKFMDDNYDPATDTVALGFDWTEDHRLAASIEPWKPWTITAPLMEPPYLQKADILQAWRDRGI